MSAVTRQFRGAAMGAAVVAALVLPGCLWMDQYRGDSFHDGLTGTGSSMRKPSSDATDYWSVSNQAHQIERDLDN